MLEKVLIRGPGCGKGLERFYNDNDKHLIIGDGINGLELGSFVQLKGSISPYTRFDIHVHSWDIDEMKAYVGNSQVHYSLFEAEAKRAKKFFSETRILFEWLKEIVGSNPLYINLWSCHSGLSEKDVIYLPEGSILVTHINKDQTSSTGMEAFCTKWALKHSDKLLAPFQDIAHNLPNFYAPLNIATYFKNSSLDIFLLNIPLPTLEILTVSQKELENSYLKLINFYNRIRTGEEIKDNVRTIFYNESDLAIPNLTEKNINDYMIGFFLNNLFQVKGTEFANTELPKLINNNKDFLKILSANNLEKEFTGLYTAAAFNNFELCKILLEAKADPNFLTNESGTALHVAAEFGYNNIVHLLIDYKVDVNIQEYIQKRTALYVAAEQGKATTVKILIENKAGIEIRNTQLATPLAIAIKNNYIEIVKLLINAQANLNSLILEGCGTSYLELADYGSHIDIVKLLLLNKADPTVEFKDSSTAYTIAKARGHEDIAELLKAYSVTDNFEETKVITGETVIEDQ